MVNILQNQSIYRQEQIFGKRKRYVGVQSSHLSPQKNCQILSYNEKMQTPFMTMAISAEYFPHCRWPLSTYIPVSSTHGSNKTNKVELYSIQMPCCSNHFITLNNKDVNMGFLTTTEQMSHHTETLSFSKDGKQTYIRTPNLSLPKSNRHTIFLPLVAKSRL